MTDRKEAEKETSKLEAVVQEKVDEETAKGYRGANTDPTPNAHYTVEGVTKGKPTPETDQKAAEKVGSAKFVDGIVGHYDEEN